MSLYCLELTPNSSNIFLLALERVCSFIVKAESSISGRLKSFSKNKKVPGTSKWLLFCTNWNWNLWILGPWRSQTHQNHWSKNERSNRRKEINILSHSKYLYGHTERKRELCTGHSPPLGRPGGNIRIRHNPTWFKWKKTLIPNGRRCLISMFMIMIIIFSIFSVLFSFWLVI